MDNLEQQRNKLRQEMRSLKASCSEQASSNEHLEHQLQVLPGLPPRNLQCLACILGQRLCAGQQMCRLWLPQQSRLLWASDGAHASSSSYGMPDISLGLATSHHDDAIDVLCHLLLLRECSVLAGA